MRLRPAGVDIAEQIGHPAFALAGVKGHAQRLRLFQIRRQLRKHRYAARDMESADHHGHARRAELAREIKSAWKLIRLNPDEPDKSAARSLYPRGRRPHVDDRVALVIGFDLDIDVRAESLLLGADGQKPVDAGEAVRRDGGATPLDHIALVVIVRRLDEDDPERPLCHGAHCSSAERRRCDRPATMRASKAIQGYLCL